MEKDLEYFKLLLELPCFKEATFFLFLTHSDIFKTTFKNIHLPEDFFDFVSSNKLDSYGPEEFLEYIVSKFRDLAELKKNWDSSLNLIHFVVDITNCKDMQATVSKTLRIISEIHLRRNLIGWWVLGVKRCENSDLQEYIDKVIADDEQSIHIAQVAPSSDT